MEAKYWLTRLRTALRIIGDTNVKSIVLMDEKGHYLVSLNEASRDFPLRQTDFPDDDYLDCNQIRRVNLNGYLPSKIDDSELHRRNHGIALYRMDYESNVIYKIFQRYIEDFLWESFGVRVLWQDFKITDPEYWSIPVSPWKREV